MILSLSYTNKSPNHNPHSPQWQHNLFSHLHNGRRVGPVSMEDDADADQKQVTAFLYFREQWLGLASSSEDQNWNTIAFL